MSDDNKLDEAFQVDGRYNQDIDRNGDKVPDRMQQGYDPNTGDPLTDQIPAPVRFGLEHTDNTPDERGHREKLAMLGATYDNAMGLGRDPGTRDAVSEAIAGASKVEKETDKKVQTAPNFHERATARALWERRRNMPKKEPGLLKNLRMIQQGANEPKTGLEIFQSLGYGLSAGVMIGARKAVRNAEIRAYKENEEFHLNLARDKDRDAALANLAAGELRDAASPVIGSNAAGPGEGGPTGGNTPPAGSAPGGPTPDGPKGPASDASPAEDNSVSDMKAKGPSFEPQTLGPAEPEKGSEPSDKAKGKKVEGIADTQSKKTDLEVKPAGSTNPYRANENLAAGAALSTVAPMAAPIVTAGATHRAQKEAGAAHEAMPRSSTGAKGPSARQTSPASVSVSYKPAENNRPTRSLAVANDGPRRENVVDINDPTHRKGGMHALASGLSLPIEKTLSKGPAQSAQRRPGAGIGTVMASRILSERKGIDVSTLDKMRDSKGATR